jgi:hypothetical protein
MTDTKNAPSLTPDQAAAHELLSELRTRISTQPLPYQFGVEARALESLWEVFGLARSAMKNHPGCKDFAARTSDMLNVDLRPVTAKWHRAYKEGRLNSRDGADEFREDLAAVQTKLREFADELHQKAYGTLAADRPTPPVLTDAELESCLTDLTFGIPRNQLIGDVVVEKMNQKEAEAVAKRRERYGIQTIRNKNAVGLGLSGGGIRSATFCLGVTQVLADRNLLKDVDFLSTVSGGGYVGSFLTMRLGRNQPHSDVANPHGPDPIPIRYLRQHAKYLSASDLKEQWSMVTASLAGMILNWTAPLFVISFITLIAVCISRFGPLPWARIFCAASFVTFMFLGIYAYRMRYARHSGGPLLGTATAATMFIGILWLLTKLYCVATDPALILKLTGIVALVVGAFPTVVRFIPVLRKPTARVVMLKVMLIVAGLIVPIGAVALSFALFHLGKDEGDAPLIVILTLFFGAVAVLLLNVNLTGPHRLYRDQLARTFIRKSEDDVDTVRLDKINPENSAPYHLINATVNLPSSTSVVLRERKGDFFLFSKEWCGAPSIGYAETDRWLAGETPVDLATAMAVSGAAASPYMGLGSFPTLSALMSFLNVRLGYWIQRPGTKSLSTTPGFLCLLREMSGVAMSEKQAWINLSDGGHIENMAVYELLRRRCKYIISIDGESDPASTFHGHLTLVRHAMIDFGIHIEPDLTSLRPDLTSKFSQTHAMMCRVHYPEAGDIPAGQGLLVYIKLSVTGNELEMIKRYRILHPDFPHQTTLDQFFDEEQFEAYRQLGVHIAEGLFARALLQNKTHPATVAEWFRCLAANLLEPGRT